VTSDSGIVTSHFIERDRPFPLLIIDDFGLKPLRPPEDEDFHDLVAERCERIVTVLTSNLHFDERGTAFAANKMIGAPEGAVEMIRC
jgi:DNA replication protein DnaC